MAKLKDKFLLLNNDKLKSLNNYTLDINESLLTHCSSKKATLFHTGTNQVALVCPEGNTAKVYFYSANNDDIKIKVEGFECSIPSGESINGAFAFNDDASYSYLFVLTNSMQQQLPSKSINQSLFS